VGLEFRHMPSLGRFLRYYGYGTPRLLHPSNAEDSKGLPQRSPVIWSNQFFEFRWSRLMGVRQQVG
jgi:hypothetical protein